MFNVQRNLTTIMDFYELTMSAGYLEEGYEDKISVFDMFFRRIPDGGGFAIMAGLAQFIESIDNLHFTPEDIRFLRGYRRVQRAVSDLSGKLPIPLQRLGH